MLKSFIAVTYATVPDPQAEEGARHIFALPGNPASALVCFYLFVLPCLRRLGGWPQDKQRLPRIPVEVSQDWPVGLCDSDLYCVSSTVTSGLHRSDKSFNVSSSHPQPPHRDASWLDRPELSSPVALRVWQAQMGWRICRARRRRVKIR